MLEVRGSLRYATMSCSCVHVNVQRKSSTNYMIFIQGFLCRIPTKLPDFLRIFLAHRLGQMSHAVQQDGEQQDGEQQDGGTHVFVWKWL